MRDQDKGCVIGEPPHIPEQKFNLIVADCRGRFVQKDDRLFDAEKLAEDKCLCNFYNLTCVKRVFARDASGFA